MVLVFVLGCWSDGVAEGATSYGSMVRGGGGDPWSRPVSPRGHGRWTMDGLETRARDRERKPTLLVFKPIQKWLLDCHCM